MKNSLINHTTLMTSSRFGVTAVPADKIRKSVSRWLASLGALILGVGFTSAASAAEFYLQAQSYTKTITLPDASTVDVQMWGFASCTDDTFATCDVLSDDPLTTVPESLAAGPQLNVDLANNPLSSTNNALTIHVNNTLNVPVSLVVPGQAGGGDPVTYPDGKGRTRMRSMTKETPAGATETYDWASLKTGTYMYQSGTQSSIQVPMGLFGSLVVNADATTDAANPVAYPGISYNSDAVLLFSEVDPVQNQRVVAAIQAALVAGSDPVATEACLSMADFNQSGGTDYSKYPCTIDYNPIYFLVNGQPTASNLPAAAQGTDILLRFLNAGLRTHTPAFVDVELGIVAEDGNPYPGLPKMQATALLPAGKTLDAKVVAPATDVTLSLFDHMPTFKNEASTNGGTLATLVVGTGTPAPVVATEYAADDVYPVIEDTPLVATSVLSNDVGIAGATVAPITQPANGTLAMAGDGTFTYTPNPNFSGSDSFTYSASLGGQSYPAVVTLNVSFENDPPVAAGDGPYINTVGTDITVDAVHGVLGNDADPDGDTLTAVIEGTVPDGLTLNADGSFTYTGGTNTSFSYRASDGTMQSGPDPVTVQLTVTPISDITLNVQEFGTDLPVTSYRWIVQEDTTFHLDPANPQMTPVRQQQSLNFHKSSMPVIAQGCTDCYNSNNLLDPALDPTDPANYQNNSIPFNQVALDPNKYYYVSVLPNDAGTGQGHTIGGAQILPGQTDVTVIVNKQEIPTAQISVFVFEDSSPTNGAVDGNENGLGGFPITLEDAGGRYGISGGTMSQDAYGNPLKNSLDCFQGYQMPPAGVILSCPNTPENEAAGLVGHVLIKDLPPGKYGVIAVPPASEKNWTQTSTIEGTKVIDAWVKAAEPPYFVEFGLTGPHAFIGFVNPEHNCIGDAPCLVPTPAGSPALHSVSGNVTLLHDPRPPALPLSVDTGSYDGLAHTRAWVGLNTDAGNGPSIAAVQANPDGSFVIPGVPDGNYQLVVWDTYLDQIISFQTATVSGGDLNLGNVGVPAWFTRTEHNVFLDDGCGEGGAGIAGDGVRQDCEVGMPEQAINLRWRDGTVNQSFPTDTTGFVPFDQAFPFFSWQILEVDYTRFKPTGVTVTVDAGGPVNETNILNPQFQDQAVLAASDADEECTPGSGCLSRTEHGSAVLLEAYQGFPGQTSTFDWGKVPYAPGENGGISGIVFYSSTRGEGDPRLTVGDPWEPGIASVKMRLYRVIQRDPTKVDTNVEPFDDFPGPGDIDLNGNNMYDGPEVLTLVQEVETDSWDKSQPTGCMGEDPADPFTVNTLEGDVNHCYDGFRNWNQVRPGVFDGGYAFNDIPPGKYVVEAVLPPGYEQYKEQDMNVGFGDAYGSNLGPAPVSVTLPNGSLMLVIPDQAMILAAQGPQYGLAQPPCVGKYHQVPDELSLFPGEPAPFAQAWRPLCDRKEVVLSDQGQAAADFHFFTSTPVAAQFTGLITDDISNETNRNSPGFGEKWSPAYMPFTIRDFNNNIVYTGLGDAFGRYNGLLPSTFTANIPIPSGYSPAMMSACLNEAGATKNNRYLSACYTGQFMPGTNTYLDTPILPTSAFAGGFNPPDCAAAEGTPVIAEVNGSGAGPLVSSGGTLQIISQGTAVVVSNPAYEGPLAPVPYNAPTITRDHSFGTTEGTVSLVVDGVSTPLTVTSWNADEILAVAPTVNGNNALTGQLVVTNDNGSKTTNAVTVTVSSETPIRVPGNYSTIQAAIDNASNGALILVAPGTYNEQVIMWKPVRLQGAGTSTVIDALVSGTTSLQAWRDKLATYLPNVDLLPGQTAISEEGAGVTVIGKAGGPPNGRFSGNPSRIDGFTITNASAGGAVLVVANADNLEIANNNIDGNSGTLQGGIRIGQPFLPGLTTGVNYSFNSDVEIHNNAITSNGALFFESAGGGVSINTGSLRYSIANNFICGNFTAGDGAGIGHLGVSNNGMIKSNTIVFNQSLNNSFTQSGGGISVGGEPGDGGALTLGSGNVTIDSNLIQGNTAASGHGGGIRTQLVNGADAVEGSTPWKITMINNMVVNNVAAYSGGGIAMQDTVNASIVNNTVANNDSTATVGGLIVNNTSSTAQPAGIVAELNSVGLANAVSARTDAIFSTTFSNPRLLLNNIIWHNRAFSYGILAAGGTGLLPELAPAAIGECAAGADYRDLGVLGSTALSMAPTSSILTDATSYPASSNNLSGDPDFLDDYCNGARTLSTPGPILATAAIGEGGNFVDVRYGPLTQAWDGTTTATAPWNYHIGATSAGLNNAVSNGSNVPDLDIDGDTRPKGNGPNGAVDRGADERVQ